MKNTTNKTWIISIITISAILISFSCTTAKEGYKIETQIQGYQQSDTSAYLVEYRGQNQYFKDTADIQPDGSFTFTGTEKLPGGMYLIAAPGLTYFDIILDKDQHFTLKTNTEGILKNMEVINSRDNQLYYEYLTYLTNKRIEAQELQSSLENATEEEKEEIRNQLRAIDKEVRQYRKDFADKNDDSFIADFIRMTLEIQVPDDLAPSSNEAFYYYRNNFFRHYDFQDPRTLRTPMFHTRFEKYLEDLTPRNPDSIIAAADHLAEKARGNEELFRYIVHHITSKYERSEYMGMDAVFVHMINNYYKTGDAVWMTDAQLDAVIDKAETLEPLLIGKTAPDIRLTTFEGGQKSLSELDAKFTILYFWDYDCGHCKRVTPDLYKTFLEYREQGVDVFAVCTQIDEEKWRDYIDKNSLHEWNNLYDPRRQSGFREKYDVYSTPDIFILDKDMKIVAKKIGVAQVPQVLDNLIQRAQ